MALTLFLMLWAGWLAPRLPDHLAITPLIRLPMSKWLARTPLAHPRIVPWWLPYELWKDEYVVHFQRLAHQPTYRLRPTLIVMHYTVSHDARSVWESFARGSRMDTGDFGFPFGHPSVHFMIDRDGTIFQLLPTNFRGTGTYGVNHVALSIEMVALDEKDLLSRPGQIYASFCLVHHLMGQFNIPLDRVIGHFDVSCGKWLVPDYLDYADSRWPHCYPPAAFRFDPGLTYMGWLRRRLKP